MNIALYIILSIVASIFLYNIMGIVLIFICKFSNIEKNKKNKYINIYLNSLIFISSLWIILLVILVFLLFLKIC